MPGCPDNPVTDSSPGDGEGLQGLQRRVWSWVKLGEYISLLPHHHYLRHQRRLLVFSICVRFGNERYGVVMVGGICDY